MGLRDISADSTTLSYHCTNPTCDFHNCANWEPFQQCAYHDTYEYVVVPAAEMKKRMEGLLSPDQLAQLGDTIMMQKTQKGRRVGKTHQIQVNDPGIKFTGPDVVALPTCQCGTQMFLKVNFTAEELAAPNIQIAVRDPQDPTKIVRIDQHPMVARHQQLAAKLTSMGIVWTPPQ